MDNGKAGTAPALEVVHPLDDVREEKCSLEGLGRLKMSRAARASLHTPRGCLLTMGLLAGALGHHGH